MSQAGVQVRLGIDSDPNCQLTYETVNLPSIFLNRNVFSMDISELHEYLEDCEPANLLFAACAPCQPFTKLNNKRSHDSAALLLSAFQKFVEAYEPAFILIENVPGIARIPGFSTYRRFLKSLKCWGYYFVEAIIDAKDYGVPQTRRRLVLIASKTFTPDFPEPTHGPGVRPYRAVKEAIGHYPAIKAGEVHKDFPNHRASGLSEINLNRIAVTPKDGGDRLTWPKELWLVCHNNGHSGHTDVFGRMWWARPSSSITCRCDSLSNGRFGHPEQNRAISLREAASLQGFADDYIFLGKTKSIIASQIGNAVPVPMAKLLGQHIIKLWTSSLAES